ncbi:fibrinogen-like protein 1 [Saccostrea cucullata]|uniref:fibrinogen-like protein 1 n=1 Tax=Saccostrea cuccullata TaxID=36930 RepID=UPI002ED4FBB9
MKSEVHPNSVAKHLKEDTKVRNESDNSGSHKNEKYVDDSGDEAKLQELQKTKNKESRNESTNLENREHKTDIVKGKNTSIKYLADGQSDPKDCYDYFLKGNMRNGVYKVRPYGTNRLIQVYCDMKKGGWTLIQKRQDGTTNFYRDWEDYREGFGGVYGEHWLGNNVIHRLTNQDHYTLRVEMTDWDKNHKYAEYSTFVVDDEDEGYKLHIGGYEGDAGDGMIKHNNKKFSTRDVDNDQVVKEFGGSCAKRFNAAWWFYKCYQSNLNGKYYRNGKIEDKKYDGVTWKPWTGTNYSLKHVEMKIRPTLERKMT